MSEPELDHLTQARDWLKDRVKACEASAEASSGRVCADTVLTVRTVRFSLYSPTNRAWEVFEVDPVPHG